MSKQLQVRGLEPEEYEDSLDAIRRYPNPPSLVSASVKLKGSIEGKTLHALEEIAANHMLEMEVALTASWEEGKQLRLFKPGPTTQIIEKPTGEIVEDSKITLRSGDREVTVTGDQLARTVERLEQEAAE